MLERWKEGPGNRTCIAMKFFKKENSQKWVLIRVVDEFKETVCFQVSNVWDTWNERGFSPMEMCAIPYISRPAFQTESEAEKYIKKTIAKELESAKEN